MHRAELVRRTLIGEHEAASIVIVTPIPAMFAALLAQGWDASSSACWWQRASLGNTDAVLVPQGGAVADLCLALPPGVRIELLGYGGALGSRFGIGDVARPATARRIDGSAQFELRGGTSGTTIVTVPHLLASYDADPDDLSGADIADMEAAHMASAAASVGIVHIGVRVLITDRVSDCPFYAIPASTRTALRRGRQGLVDQFVADLAEEGML